MRALRVLLSRLMQSVGLGRHRGDLDAELESHIALHTDDNMRSGMSPEDARRAALLAFGSAQATREVLHEQNGAPFVGIVSSTVRQAFRSLVRHPGFSVVRSRSTSGSSMAWDGCSILRTCRAAPSRNPPRVEPSPACAEAGQGVRPAAVMGGRASHARLRHLGPYDEVDVAIEHLQERQELIDGLAVVRLIKQPIQLRR